jgi:hypothetical protein
MNCYECSRKGTPAEAVASCVSCGAGVCGEHVRPEAARVDQHATVGIPVTGTVRRLLCVTCDDAMVGHRLDEAS